MCLTRAVFDLTATFANQSVMKENVCIVVLFVTELWYPTVVTGYADMSMGKANVGSLADYRSLSFGTV
jgi:K+-transporting ATPase c subunit